MDLKNNRITIGEILANNDAKAILKRDFPELMTPFMLRLARNMTLENVLKYSKGRYSVAQINKTLEALKKI